MHYADNVKTTITTNKAIDITINFLTYFIHRKNDFAEGSKILLDTDQNNFVGSSK